MIEVKIRIDGPTFLRIDNLSRIINRSRESIIIAGIHHILPILEMRGTGFRSGAYEKKLKQLGLI